MSDQGDHHSARREYDVASLARSTLPADPLILFGAWLAQALDAGAKDATAMALATADRSAVPAVRIVLLKDHSAAGFTWFTDYGSQKGQDIEHNPVASAVFYWRDFDRQVRISGPVARLDEKTSRAYFDSRPVDSRFSAAASNQSQPVADRVTLEERVAALRARYPTDDVPMPENWGGYRLQPQRIEFWQGREGRLHDRFLYTRIDSREGDSSADWHVERLQP